MAGSLPAMRIPTKTAIVAAVAASALAGGSTAGAAGIAKAHGSTRAALVHAFVVQDGTSVGVYAVFTSGSAGVVCQKTPDAGKIRALFSGSGRSWRYVFTTRSTRRGASTQRRLEAAC
jgi:hypothetical protein